MTQASRRTLFWTPRVLSIAYILFLSVFALDVFGAGLGIRALLVALTIHLAPALILLLALVLAWRWEWIGATVFAAAGFLYIGWVMLRPISPALRFTWISLIAGPALVVAALFLANWRKRAEMHAG